MSKVYRGTLFNDQCRFYLTNSTELIQEINEKRVYSPSAIAALGRSTLVTNILGIMGKDDTKVSTIIKGGGPIGQIIVTANAIGQVKAKVTNPLADAPKISDTKLNVGAVVGKEGSLKVIKDLNVKEPFISDVPLQSGEIGIDYAYYFTASEQVPTAVSVGVLVDKDHSIKNASLFLVQVMPDCSEDTIEKLEKIFNELDHISTEMLSTTEEEFLEDKFNGDYKILDVIENSFKCDCSRKKYIDALRLLDPKDIIEIKSEKEIECVCDFCCKKYYIKTEVL